MEEIKEEVAVEEVEESLDNENIKQLRQEYKKLKAENKQYKSVAMDSALNSIGLSSDKGLGKAVTKLYDGDVTVDAITDFVSKEFGEVNAINADTIPTATPNQNVIEAQSRVEQLNKLGVQPTPEDSFSDLNAFINNPKTSVKSSISAKLHAIDVFDGQTKK
tara:strand:- start:150 stop:635 length:486 start_codon:yes stop_codon:yes gene_type:complete